MRLAIVSPFPPGISGKGQYGARVAEGLARSGCFDEIRVFANRRPGAPTVERRGGFDVQRAWNADGLAAAAEIARAVRAWRPDVAWFNLGLAVFGPSRLRNFVGLAAPLLARAGGLATVVTLHEIFEATNLPALGAANGRLTRWGGEAATRMVLGADTVCLTLDAYVQLFKERYGAHNLAHVPHGVFDTPLFAPLPAEKRILMFGMQAPYKRLPDLVGMYRELRDADEAVRLTIAGSDHPRFPGYLAEARARARGLPGVEWDAEVAEERVPGLFAAARVVAMPMAATTGASSVAHRAASHGRPVVAYDLPDLRAVVAEENLRLELIPNGDRAGFLARLRELLNDPDECEAIGRANVDVTRSMTLDVTCRRYVEIFCEAAGRIRPHASLARPPGLDRRPPLAPQAGNLCSE